MSSSPEFTVLTPTYNRAHTLAGVYESLCAQTLREFEWVIVDDGSTDGTTALVGRWKDEGRCDIQYFYQPNQGKHVAVNLGVKRSRGQFLLILDSDDRCSPQALERFQIHWESIPEQSRNSFSGVTCLCMTADGAIVGSPFPERVIDSDSISLYTRYRIHGEKWGFHRTEILRQFPYPVFEGERFIPEGIVWNRIAKRYKLRFVNEPLRIFEPGKDGLTAQIRRVRIQSPLGARLYYLEYAQAVSNWWHRARAVINYFRFSAHAKVSPRRALADVGVPRRFSALLPLGYLWSALDHCFRR